MSVDEAILMVLGGVSGKYNKRYCYPSQAHILRLLERIYLVQISRRTLNRHLKKLEQRFYFERVQRHIRGPGEKAVFRTTMYKLRASIFNLAKTFGRFLKRFDFPRRVPLSSHYSSDKRGRDLKNACGNVEILWKPDIKCMPSP